MITISMITALIMPPKEYVYEPTVPYEVHIAYDNRYIDVLCPVEGYIVLGCTFSNIIYIRNDLTEDAFEKVLTHEKAHINGWTHE